MCSGRALHHRHHLHGNVIPDAAGRASQDRADWHAIQVNGEMDPSIRGRWLQVAGMPRHVRTTAMALDRHRIEFEASVIGSDPDRLPVSTLEIASSLREHRDEPPNSIAPVCGDGEGTASRRVGRC